MVSFFAVLPSYATLYGGSVNVMSASPPARTFSMSAICVASPQSNRCWSRTHTSPRTVTMASCSAGTASGSVSPSCVVSGSRSNSSTSSSVKPTRSRLNASSFSDSRSTRSSSSPPPPRRAGGFAARMGAAPLRFREVIQHNDRHLFHAQASSSCQARVPGDHYAVGTDKDRVRPPEFDDAGGNLSHLFVRVRPGVPGVRDQLVDGPNLYGEVAEARRRCTHAGDFPIRSARFRRHAWAFLFGP